MPTPTPTLPSTGPPSANADRRRWYALALLCLASFMVILDAQIVTVAVPSIERDLGLSAADVQWILSGYSLAFGGLLLLGGRTADLFGRRRIFMLGVGLFVVSSLVCGLAWSPTALVVARAVQGISAALMAPAAMAILITTFTKDSERNKALGAAGAVAGLGGCAGSFAGGPLTQWLGWEWIFLLNVPIGVAMLLLSPLLLRRDGARTRQRVDVAGALAISGSLVLLVNGVSQAPQSGWLSVGTWGSLLGAVVLFVVFVFVERRSPAPLVPFSLFRSRVLVGGNLVTLTAAVGAYGQSILLTQYAQQVLGYSPAQFGLMSGVVPVMAVIGSVLSQRFVTKVGFRSVAIVSMSLMAAGCLLLTQLSANGSFMDDMFWGMLVLGPGLGAGTVAANIAALSRVSENESGLASGVSNTAFQIGGALGVAVLTTVALLQTQSIAGAVAKTEALAQGYAVGFAVAAGVSLLGVLAAALLLRVKTPARS